MELSNLNFETIVIPALYVAGALILTHFFEDSDKQRIEIERMRARYFLMRQGPIKKIEQNRNVDEVIVQVLEDFLRLRIIRIHFLIISLTTVFGLAFMIIISSHLFFCYIYNKIVSVLLSMLMVYFWILQWFYIAQQSATLKRIIEFETRYVGDDQCFEQQIYKKYVDVREVRPLESRCFYRISNYIRPIFKRPFILFIIITILETMIILSYCYIVGSLNKLYRLFIGP